MFNDEAISLALGANREGKGRVKGKASRIQRSRIGSALVYVRRNAQHPELKLFESTQFVLNTALMVAVSTRGPTGASKSSSLLVSKYAIARKILHKP